MIKLSWTFKDYPITQPFGRTSFSVNNPNIYRGMLGHNGIDFGMPEGTPIRACHDGVVVRDVDNDNSGAGIYVCIWDTEQHIATYYLHMIRNIVGLGRLIKKGEIIGYVGSTGIGTGAHLHFGIVETDMRGYRVNRGNGYNGYINPLSEDIVWEDKD